MENLTLNKISILNNAIDAGLRTITFLNARYPNTSDFDELVIIDHVLVNSDDFSGPPSLHPKIPNRLGELNSRRTNIQEGIELMIKYELIEVEFCNSGLYYRATEKVDPLLDLMKSGYSKSLRTVSEWLASEIEMFGLDRINKKLVLKESE